MPAALRDLVAYFHDVGLAYQILSGAFALWLVYQVLGTPWLPASWKPRMDKWKHRVQIVVFLLLLVAPFGVWRVQQTELHSCDGALAAALARADSLERVIPALVNQA